MEEPEEAVQHVPAVEKAEPSEHEQNEEGQDNEVQQPIQERNIEDEEEVEQQEQQVGQKQNEQLVIDKAMLVVSKQKEDEVVPPVLVQHPAREFIEERASFEESLILPEPVHQIDNQSQINVHPIPKKPKEKHTKKPSHNGQSLQQNKLVRQIFTHFCKENYISSIKSTLFQDKQKVMQEMSLNKWMVFCKEFDIFSQLCSKMHQRRKVSEEQGMESSQVREQLRVKEVKEIEKSLSNIFKKATENHTKMQYPHFIAAIKLLREQFNFRSQDATLHSDIDFAKKHLFCQSEKECMTKLSNLRFTFGIPQIEYTRLPAFDHKDKSKSKLALQTKQNYNDMEMTKKNKNISSNESRTMLLNPIIKEAKNVLSSPESKSSLTTLRKYGPKAKPIADQPKAKPKGKGKAKDGHQSLLKYFDESRDQILESYFKVERMQQEQIEMK